MANGGGAVYWRIRQLEKDAEEARKQYAEANAKIEAKLDRLFAAVIGFAFTIAASAIGFVLIGVGG